MSLWPLPETTALDDPPDRLSDFEQAIVANIREDGFHCNHILADEAGPSFSYTAGFCISRGAAEIITFDLPHHLAAAAFWTLFELGDLPIGTPIEKVFTGEVVYLMPVSDEAAAEYLLSTRWLYRDQPFPCLQLVWCDPAGRFPWDEGFSDALRPLQPDLSPSGWPAAVRR